MRPISISNLKNPYGILEIFHFLVIQLFTRIHCVGIFSLLFFSFASTVLMAVFIYFSGDIDQHLFSDADPTTYIAAPRYIFGSYAFFPFIHIFF